MEKKPRILISRCLLGEAVRYDGGHRHAPLLVSRLEREAELVPICPEVEAGLGVPRPPIRLRGNGGTIRVVGAEDPALDVTEALLRAIRSALAAEGPLHGAVLKARSPSCGVLSTPRFDAAGVQTGSGPGLLAQVLEEAFPGLPLREEEMLDSPPAVTAFLAEVRRYFGR